MSILLEMKSEPQGVWQNNQKSIHILPRIGVVVNEKNTGTITQK
jgi:hypothetical protein